MPTYDLTYHNNPALDTSPTLNLTTGTAAFCLDSIVQYKDLIELCERIKNRRENGKTIQNLVKETSRVSAC